MQKHAKMKAQCHTTRCHATPCNAAQCGQQWPRLHPALLPRGPLLPNLLRHQNPDTFPASGLLALRLLAFFASWLRYHFAPGRVLRMSAGMLELLKVRTH